MQTRDWQTRLLQIATVVEVAAGLTLIAAPSLFVRLLLGSELAGAGMSVGRIAGCALLALGIACWPVQKSTGAAANPLRAMLIYNSLVAIYLCVLGVSGDSIGLLLWPGVVLHGTLSLLLMRACGKQVDVNR